MVIGEAREDDRSEMSEEYDVSECTDDSDDDPSFDVLEETRSALSNISLKKTRYRREKDVDADLGSESEMEAMGDEIPKLDEKDEKCFEKVEELVKGGHFEKLKLDQCKIYLRKYGLRLTGNKGVLVSRIREHQEIKDGCGEKKYPPGSFLFNCKGDACLGDVVIFEQNVYEMFSIASRSATGPPCGTRTVAGRIVKESYGAAKQQHTFTIEVLWSKGVKPLQPLQQLLIKGRNLYRIKTMRQRWVDEGQRSKSLQEKHARGSSARYSREIRLQEKEKRKKGMVIKRKDKNGDRIPANKENQHQINPQKADVLRNKFGNNKEHKYEQEIRSNVTRVASIQQIVNESSVLQQPSQSILGEAKIEEHSIFSTYARKSCENDFRGAQVHGILHPKPWNVGYAKHHGSQHYHHHHHGKPRGFYQPRDQQHHYKAKLHEFQEHHQYKRFPHHMHQASWENHCTQIPLQQQHSERQRLQYSSQNHGW